ncbi:hypothetical protein HDU79_002380 [Rhizoclosmatium sp. JEL0117]|nr:hypothetical protein HDU79_002380 [Rhizoclosmatium sp. JEL0117]
MNQAVETTTVKPAVTAAPTGFPLPTNDPVLLLFGAPVPPGWPIGTTHPQSPFPLPLTKPNPLEYPWPPGSTHYIETPAAYTYQSFQSFNRTSNTTSTVVIILGVVLAALVALCACAVLYSVVGKDLEGKRRREREESERAESRVFLKVDELDGEDGWDSRGSSFV